MGDYNSYISSYSRLCRRRGGAGRGRDRSLERSEYRPRMACRLDQRREHTRSFWRALSTPSSRKQRQRHRHQRRACADGLSSARRAAVRAAATTTSSCSRWRRRAQPATWTAWVCTTTKAIIPPTQNSGDPRGGYPTYYFSSMLQRGYRPVRRQAGLLHRTGLSVGAGLQPGDPGELRLGEQHHRRAAGRMAGGRGDSLRAERSRSPDDRLERGFPVLHGRRPGGRLRHVPSRRLMPGVRHARSGDEVSQRQTQS